MAHDPKREDYQRLVLRMAHELEENESEDVVRSFSTFGMRFAQDRESLPQSDSDRAFNLVALATEAIDYELPFATGERAETLVEQAHSELTEALALDPNCFDAARMLSSYNVDSVETRYRWLAENEETVRAYCEAERDKLSEEAEDERLEMARNLAMRPYWRWLASMAEEALICGRNRETIQIARRALESDPHDMSDVRFTLAYALAKLEDDAGFEELERNYSKISPLRSSNDAWMGIARVALAYKRCNFVEARTQLSRLLESYPGAGYCLILQSELPDGEFARLNVRPYTEDEMVLAVSEGIVLFQEGVDRSGKGVFGAWIASETARLDPQAAARAYGDDSDSEEASDL